MKKAKNTTPLYIIYVLCLLICFAVNSVHAQKENNTISYLLSGNEGLSSEEIKKVFQDKQGFMWFATTEGLLRYDGYEFKTFTTSEYINKGLITNYFMDIAQNNPQYLWCATDHGVARFDLLTEEFSFFNPIENIWGNNSSYCLINSITIDTEQNLWIGTAGSGVYKYSIIHGELQHYSKKTKELNMISEWITKLYCDSQGNIWICTWEGNLMLINERLQFYKSWLNIGDNINFTEFSPFCITEDDQHYYWVGLWGKGLLRFRMAPDGRLIDTKLINNEKENSIIYDIEFDKDNNLWLGSPGGIIKVSDPYSMNPEFNPLNVNYKEETPTPQHEVFSVYCDRSGIMWCGTYTGVSVWDPVSKLFSPYDILSEKSKLYSQTVTAFTYDKQNRLLIGVRGLGFGTYDLTEKKFTSFLEQEPYNHLPDDLNSINCFFWDSNGFLWLGTRYLGVIKMNPSTGKYIMINQDSKDYGFEGEMVSSIVEDQIGNIWIGTEKGVFKIIPHKPIDLQNFSIVNYRYQNGENSLSSDQISSIIQDSKNRIWIATQDKGINLLTSDVNTHFPATFEHYDYNKDGKHHLTTNQIMVLYEDSQNTIWVGTAGGGLLCKKSNDEQFHLIDKGIDTTNDVINGLCEDNNNNLWISTNHGLIKYQHSTPQLQSWFFSQANGLQSNQFTRNAVFKTKNGDLMFGGNKGFNYFNPSEVHSNPYAPTPAITKLQIGNTKRPVNFLQSNIELTHKENSISFTMSALSYSDPQSNLYATQLLGVDNEMRNTDASSRTVTYANLKPGSYTLLYNASNNNGVWQPQPQQFTIVVHPAIYETWYAIVFYIMVVLTGLCYYIYKERQSQNLVRALEIEHIEHEKSEKLLDFKKQLFANISNELATPLNILYVFVQNWKNKKVAPNQRDLNLAQRNIHRLIRYTKQLLYYSSAEINKVSISVNRYDLEALINEVIGNFELLMQKKEIFFKTDYYFNTTSTYFDEEKIDIVLYNLISFAIKHTPYKGGITLTVSTSKENNNHYATFSLTYTTVSNVYKSVQEDLIADSEDFNISKDFGIGMAITKQMIELHKGELWIEEQSKNSIEILFRIPVSKESYSSPEQEKSSSKIDFLKNTPTIEEEIITSLKNLNQSQDERSTILIIEPDADLRGVIVNQLNPYFNMKEAGNGQRGLKYMEQQTVDLVISNNVTSNISGIEICKEIKKRKKDEYVPFILLSGRPTEEERALSYKAGADSYIPIPIDINTLLLRVQNLIEQKSQSSTKNKSEIKSISAQNNISNKFLNDVSKIVKKHLSDPQFTVKQLAQEVNVSNSMLYRKLMKSVELNPNAFIKKMRLLKAVQLLEETDLTISEIAYKCGFTDMSYFGYSFKKQYGISPTNYRQNINKS